MYTTDTVLTVPRVVSVIGRFLHRNINNIFDDIVAWLSSITLCCIFTITDLVACGSRIFAPRFQKKTLFSSIL